MDNYDTKSNHILTKLLDIVPETSDEENEISKIITSLNDLVRRVGIYKGGLYNPSELGFITSDLCSLEEEIKSL